jgi:hypothetical protein
MDQVLQVGRMMIDRGRRSSESAPSAFYLDFGAVRAVVEGAPQ